MGSRSIGIKNSKGTHQIALTQGICIQVTYLKYIYIYTYINALVDPLHNTHQWAPSVRLKGLMQVQAMQALVSSSPAVGLNLIGKRCRHLHEQIMNAIFHFHNSPKLRIQILRSLLPWRGWCGKTALCHRRCRWSILLGRLQLFQSFPGCLSKSGQGWMTYVCPFWYSIYPSISLIQLEKVVDFP